MKLKDRIIPVAIITVVSLWLIDAAIDHLFFFQNYSFIELLISNIPQHVIYQRLLLIFTITVFTLIVIKYALDKEKNTEELKEAVKELDLTLNSITDGVIQIDNNSIIKKMNPVAEGIIGYSSKELLEKPLDNFYDPYSIDNDNETLSRPKDLILSSKEKYEKKELKFYNKFKELFYISESAAKLKDEHGNTIGVIIIIRDITEEKEAEQRLIQSEHKFYRIYSLSPDAVIIARKEDSLIYDINKSFIRIFGYEKKHIVNQQNLDDLIWEDDKDRERFYSYLNENKNVIQYEAKLSTNKDKSVIGLISASFISLNEESCIIYYIQDVTQSKEAELMLLAATEELEAIVDERTEELKTANEELELINEDITREMRERALAEEALKESEKKFRTLMQQIPVGVYRSSVSGEIVQANDKLAQILGYEKAEDVIGKSAYDFYDTYLTRNEVVQLGIETGKYVKEELKLKRKDGSYIWVFDNGQVIFGENGEPLYTDGILEDISDRKETEFALKESEEKYRSLFENLHDIFFILDDKAIIRDISPSAYDELGYSTDELINKKITELLAHKKDKIKFFKKIIRDEMLNTFTVAITKKDGSIAHIAADFNLKKDYDGKITAIEGIARNVTANVKYQDFLSTVYNISKAVNTTDTLEELYPIIHNSIKQLIEARNFVIALYNKETGIISFPYLIDEKDDFIPEVNIENKDSLTVQVIRSGKPLLLNEDDILKMVDLEDGESVGSLCKVWLGVPLKIKGEIIGAIIVQSYTNKNAYKEQDITLMQSVSDQIANAIERKRAEVMLNFQLEFLQNLIDTIPNPIFYKDISKRYFIGCNKAFEEFHNMKKEEIIGKSVYELFPPEQALIYDTKDIELINSRDIQVYDSVVKKLDGSTRDVVFYKSVYYDNEDEVAGIVGVILDITGRKKAERELRQAREYAELMFKLTPSSIFTVDKQCKITSWNERIAKLTGYSAEEVIGKHCRIIAPPGKECIESELFSKTSQRPIYDLESKIMTKNGEERIVSKNIDFLYDTNGKVIGGIESFEDITQRKKVEEALYWQAGLNSSLADISRAIFSQSSIRKISQLILDNSLRLTNSQHGFVCNIDEKTGDIQITANSENIPYQLSKNGNGKLTNTDGPWSYILKSKSSFFSNNPSNDPVLKDNKIQDIDSFSKIMGAPGISGDEMTGLIFVNRDEKDYTDQDLNVLERLSSLLSIALKRIQAENEVHAALEKEQELNELKSRFISMVSHEYRTPLTAIVLSTELLSDYADKLTKENREKYFQRIRDAVKTMNNLLDDIITYNKVQIGKIQFEPDMTDIEQMCLNLSREMQFMAKEKNTIDLTVNNGNVLANIDEKIVRQILINVIINAIRYSPEGTVIEFIVNAMEDKTEFIIKDKGIGIPEEERSKIFDPFFRGSNLETQSGSGLGLSIARNFVDAHNGEIDFESTVGKGTTFYVTIPYHEKKKVNKKSI